MIEFLINNWLLLIYYSCIINLFKNYQYLKPDRNIKEFIEDGAIIIDVRTEFEFKSGNIKNSINVPLKEYRVNEFSKERNILLCAIGMRAE